MELEIIYENTYNEYEEALNARKLMAGAALGLGLATAGIPKLHAKEPQKVERSVKKDAVRMTAISEDKFLECFHLDKDSPIKTLSDGTQLVRYVSDNGKFIAYTNFELRKGGSSELMQVGKTGKAFFDQQVSYEDSEYFAYYKVGSPVAGNQAYAIVLPVS